ncbi:MAG: hypothetical protein ACXVB4_16910 [Pseudobdellovibrionaceae bacterium]
MIQYQDLEMKDKSQVGIYLNDSSKCQASSVLECNKNKIMKIWETKVREQVSEAQDQSSFVLVNSLAAFLDEVTLILLEDQSLTVLVQKGMFRLHGAQRAGFRGYFLPHLLNEFSISTFYFTLSKTTKS